MLATEIYKTKQKISPEIVNSLFEFTNKNCNLRNASILKRKRYFAVNYGSENLSSVGPENMGTCSRFNQRGKNIINFQK